MTPTVFLSRLALDPRSRRVRSELQSPYELHRTLSCAFARRETSPEDEKRALAAARVLFRVDGMDEWNRAIVLVQSRTEPVWDGLTALPDYFAEPAAVREFAVAIPQRARFAFRLRANPTVKRDGKRRGLYREEEQLAWLQRKGLENGFRLESATSVCEARMLRSRRGDSIVEHLAVRFDGVLVVEDAALISEAIAAGVGAAKGFGFGLLSLARVK